MANDKESRESVAAVGAMRGRQPKKQQSAERKQIIQDRRDRVAAVRDDEAGAPTRRVQRESSDEIELPTLDKLERKLKRMKDAEEIRTMQSADDRKGAQELYEARLAELSGEAE